MRRSMRTRTWMEVKTGKYSSLSLPAPHSSSRAEMVNKIMAELKKRENKKDSARSAAFQAQKAALFIAARKAAVDLARDGAACFEEGRTKILEMRKEEVSAEKYSKNVVPLWHSVEDCVQALLSIYPTGIEDLFPRRSHLINLASEMLRSNPTNRGEALAECLQTANSQLYQSKMDETIAADASLLIKHYKTLLLN
ncbi:hypothetical protein C8J57DRAFT_660125 [Mycena rebaudengoi]|nr:hypothetical protein C8J57DRAFT_660125 [Mycena rebaudengoi]